MASKKGIAVTVIILAAITGASFSLWLIEPENETTLVVTDYQNYLDGVENIHEVLQESIDIEYQNLRDGKISPEDYITITEITSSQVTTQISEFITSKPSEQWQESYINYMESMKKFNEYNFRYDSIDSKQNKIINSNISVKIKIYKKIKLKTFV